MLHLSQICPNFTKNKEKGGVWEKNREERKENRREAKRREDTPARRA